MITEERPGVSGKQGPGKRLVVLVAVGAVALAALLADYWLFPVINPMRAKSRLSSLAAIWPAEDATYVDPKLPQIAQSIAKLGPSGAGPLIRALRTEDLCAPAAYALMWYPKGVAKDAIPAMKETLARLCDSHVKGETRVHLYGALALASPNPREYTVPLRAIAEGYGDEQTVDFVGTAIALIGRLAKEGVESAENTALLRRLRDSGSLTARATMDMNGL